MRAKLHANSNLDAWREKTSLLPEIVRSFPPFPQRIPGQSQLLPGVNGTCVSMLYNEKNQSFGGIKKSAARVEIHD
jgi:hypothetical protein